MLKERITALIREVLDSDHGFEIYVVMKDETLQRKRLIVEEGENGGFKQKIRDSIAKTIREKYCSEESLYAAGDELANEQDRFYVITQDENYRPFDLGMIPEGQLENFRLEDKDNADALLFQFIIQRGGTVKQLWAYQKLQPAAIPNRRQKGFQLIVKSRQEPDVFREMEDQMFIITPKVDILILGDEIITDEIKLMERHLGLETFLRTSAGRAADLIAESGLVKDTAKLKEYAERRNKRYAKKMMQIHKFPVASMQKDELLNKLRTVERWKNVFDVEEGQVRLKTYADVERLIDLFTERYTKSEVTGQEYDTEVKDKAEPLLT